MPTIVKVDLFRDPPESSRRPSGRPSDAGSSFPEVTARSEKGPVLGPERRHLLRVEAVEGIVLKFRRVASSDGSRFALAARCSGSSKCTPSCEPDSPMRRRCNGNSGKRVPSRASPAARCGSLRRVRRCKGRVPRTRWRGQVGVGRLRVPAPLPERRGRRPRRDERDRAPCSPGERAGFRRRSLRPRPRRRCDRCRSASRAPRPARAPPQRRTCSSCSSRARPRAHRRKHGPGGRSRAPAGCSTGSSISLAPIRRDEHAEAHERTHRGRPPGSHLCGRRGRRDGLGGSPPAPAGLRIAGQVIGATGHAAGASGRRTISRPRRGLRRAGPRRRPARCQRETSASAER